MGVVRATSLASHAIVCVTPLCGRTDTNATTLGRFSDPNNWAIRSAECVAWTTAPRSTRCAANDSAPTLARPSLATAALSLLTGSGSFCVNGGEHRQRERGLELLFRVQRVAVHLQRETGAEAGEARDQESKREVERHVRLGGQVRPHRRLDQADVGKLL